MAYSFEITFTGPSDPETFALLADKEPEPENEPAPTWDGDWPVYDR